MTALTEVLARIEASPQSSRVAAVFDFDGTVISGYSASNWYRHRLMHGELGPRELIRTAAAAVAGVHTAEEYERLLVQSVRTWAGRDEAELEALGASLVANEIGGQLHAEAWQLINAHRARGHQIVVASSATRFQVEPLAHELGADHVLCTPLETEGGVLTGRLGGAPLWGAAKADAVRSLSRRAGFTLKHSFAYSNGAEDLPLLKLVGSPIALAPENGLADAARRHEWPVVECERRGGTPGVRDVARTTAFYGGLLGGLATGLGVAAVRRSRRQVWDIGTIGADVGLSLAGVDIDVTAGAEHLWSDRPCVFVFNHQSTIDSIVLMKLIRERFTTNAELANVRDEHLSLLISPEGRPSLTPRMGPFKPGAFHIAMRAGVPIVPIVLRNAGEILWKGSRVVKPGRIDVVVLPPVPSTGWMPEDLGDRAAEVRQSMVDVLEEWPA
jgi:putative phosphoserine phosphatase/1-acylglycerol-3-phosphate O-acyltransferase